MSSPLLPLRTSRARSTPWAMSGDVPFVGQGNSLLAAVCGEHGDGVGVVLEPDTRGGHVVGHDEVEPFAAQLADGVLPDVLGLGREADEDLARALVLVAAEVDE